MEFDARFHDGIEASPSRTNILSQIYIFSDERINQSPDSTPTTVRGVAVRFWLTRFYGGNVGGQTGSSEANIPRLELHNEQGRVEIRNDHG